MDKTTIIAVSYTHLDVYKRQEILKCQTKEDIGQNKRYTERET